MAHAAPRVRVPGLGSVLRYRRGRGPGTRAGLIPGAPQAQPPPPSGPARGRADPAATPRRPTRPGTGSRAACAAARHRRSRRRGRRPRASRCVEQRREESRGGPRACASGVAAAHANPRLDERAQQPRPDRSLVIGAVALRARRPRTAARSRARPRASVRRPSGVQQPPLDRVHDCARARARRAAGTAGRRRRRSGSAGTVASSRPADVVRVDHVEQAARGASFQNRSANAASPRVVDRADTRAVNSCRDPERVQPQRLDLDRLADPRASPPSRRPSRPSR